MCHINHVLKKNKSSSVVYRSFFAEQTRYLEGLEELLPWLEEEEVGGATTPQEKGCGSSGAKKGVEGTESVAMDKTATSNSSKATVAMAAHVPLLEWLVRAHATFVFLFFC